MTLLYMTLVLSSELATNAGLTLRHRRVGLDVGLGCILLQLCYLFK